MARTTAEIYEELEGLAHSSLTSSAVGRALLKGLARVFSYHEDLFDGTNGWLDQLTRSTASNSFLDALASDRSAERYPWETDADFRAFAIFTAKVLTPDVWRRETARILQEGYTVRIVEPIWSVLGEDFALDDASAILVPGADDGPRPAKLVWAFFPIPETVDLLVAYLGEADGATLGIDIYLDEQDTDPDRVVYRRLSDALERLRPFGTAIGWTIDDWPQTAYFDQLWSD